MSEELVFQLGLELIPGIGAKGVKQLISYCGSASAVFNTTKSRLVKIPGVGEKIARTIKSADPFREAKSIIMSCERVGVDIIHSTNPKYPKRLKQISDSPNILYTKGRGELNPKKIIAIVGTRSATNYGKKITDQIVSDLAFLGVDIISGLAYGIDIHAHKVALRNNLSTFAILAGGLDRIYPSAHKKYVQEILETGGIVSESIPGIRPDPHLFPSRNRIIAGMSDATLVVEAAEKGGALITANLADAYNRPVFAVPGDVGNRYSTGTNKLIASQKALIYTGVEDLIYHLGWDIEHTKKREPPVKLTEEERVLYNLLQENDDALEIDSIALKSQTPINQVASVLLALEFKNLVKSLPGKKYVISKIA